MRKIIVIGTDHFMMPKYKNEFEKIIEEINPDQVLVEIVHKHLNTKDIKKYPKEMIFAYKWALKNKKKSDGFDSDVKYERNVSKWKRSEIKKIVLKLIKKYNWKELNKKKHHKTMYDIIGPLIYMNKLKIRQRKMLQKIEKKVLKSGVVIVLTGCGHLEFFEKYLKGAEFPLRQSK